VIGLFNGPINREHILITKLFMKEKKLQLM